MAFKYQISLSMTGRDSETGMSLVDTGISIELPDQKTARNLYRLLDQILRDAGARLGATRRGAVNVKPLGEL